MRNRIVGSMIAVAVLSGGRLSAQSWGPTSLGLQGGFTYIKYTGTRFFDSELHLPGFSLAPYLPTPASLYLISADHGPSGHRALAGIRSLRDPL